jgi:eukaryotic-like serine/threonine-protein kinase
MIDGSRRSPAVGANLPEDLVHDLTRGGAVRCGPYELLEVLATVRQGWILRGRRADGAEHAVRLIDSKPERQRCRIERWLERARRVRQLGLAHPYLACLHEVDVEQGRPWCSEDLGRGPGLDELLREGKLSREAGLEALALAARAIGHAQARGVNHHDLTPSMILVPAGQPPLVVGYGLSFHGLEVCVGIDDETTVGTPIHVAPEVVIGDVGRLGPTAEVFVLGMILFQVLTGRRPFDGAHVMAVFDAVLHRPAPRPSSLEPTLPRALEEVCLHALEKKPERRPRDAGAFADELVAAMIGGRAPVWTPEAPSPPPASSGPRERGIVGRLVGWITGA